MGASPTEEKREDTDAEAKVVKSAETEDDSDGDAVANDAEPEAIEADTDDGERIGLLELNDDEREDDDEDDGSYERRRYRPEGTRTRPRRSLFRNQHSAPQTIYLCRYLVFRTSHAPQWRWRLNVTYLDPRIRLTPVSRKFLSGVYGGSCQDPFPSISKENLRKHGRKHWFYYSLLLHPQAPPNRVLWGLGTI